MSFRPYVLVLVLAAASATRADVYDFVQQSSSGVSIGTTSINATTSGTLIGDWDPTTNPGGTRTKPGVFGTFGTTENVAVPLTLAPHVSGSPNVPTEGIFQLDIDFGSSSLVMSGYASAMSSVNPPTGSLALSADFGTPQGFRTRAPDSTYIPGTFNVPFGSATITGFQLDQNVATSLGTLTPQGGGVYDFSVATTADLTFKVLVLGNEQIAGPISVPLVLTGTLTITGSTATVLSSAAINVDDTQMPNQVIPDFTTTIPTILPPGGNASLIFSLTLTEISTILQGTVTNDASGIVVPEPAGSVALAAVVLAMKRRRY